MEQTTPPRVVLQKEQPAKKIQEEREEALKPGDVIRKDGTLDELIDSFCDCQTLALSNHREAAGGQKCPSCQHVHRPDLVSVRCAHCSADLTDEKADKP